MLAGKSLSDFLFPRRCAVCSRSLDLNENGLCVECRQDLPLTYFWGVEENAMSERLNGIISERLLSEESLPEDGPMQRVEGYCHAVALLFYREGSTYRLVPQMIKYKGARPLAREMGLMLGGYIASVSWMKQVDVIVPVPLSFRRRLSRGYNQAELISRGIALGMESHPTVEARLLYRRRHTRTQTKLSSSEKKANVRGAFSVSGRGLKRMGKARHVLIVDDVCTSGSTLVECYFTLKTALPHGTVFSFACLSFVER